MQNDLIPQNQLSKDKKWMRLALMEAKKAQIKGEIPVGAILIKNNKILAKGHNQREKKRDPLSHAELETLRKGAKILKNWRIGGSLYVTLEPCPMCLGALLQARVKEIIFACTDPKGGALGGKINLLENNTWNHSILYRQGILEKECQELLQNFFKTLRTKKRQNK